MTKETPYFKDTIDIDENGLACVVIDAGADIPMAYTIIGKVNIFQNPNFIFYKKYIYKKIIYQLVLLRRRFLALFFLYRIAGRTIRKGGTKICWIFFFEKLVLPKFKYFHGLIMNEKLYEKVNP